jgi:hypothetical protein
LVVVTRILLKARSAFGAKAFAVLPAHRLERQGGDHCVPQNRLKIDDISLDPVLLFFLFCSERLSVLVVEEFLHIDFLVVRDGLQAPSAFSLNRSDDGSGYQNPLVHGFEPQVQIKIRTLRYADKRNTEVLRCRNMFVHSPHDPRAAPEILDTNGQGRRTRINPRLNANENSCRT